MRHLGAITLWSQAVAGDRNLLVIPLEDALLYVEPVYLRPRTPVCGAAARDPGLP